MGRHVGQYRNRNPPALACFANGAGCRNAMDPLQELKAAARQACQERDLAFGLDLSHIMQQQLYL